MINNQSKKIHFYTELIPLVLSGEKTVTWRLFDDKDLKKGDWLELLETNTERIFGLAEIVEVKEKKMGDLTEADREGHEGYANMQQMYETYMRYYGKPVGPETVIKIVKFKLLKQD